ncbi:MAG: DUF6263 family protein [Limisphaerales bacterium]
MKKLTVIFPLCVAIGFALLPGCSKSKNVATPSGTNSDFNASSAADGAVDMKIKWMVGKTYAMRMEMTQTSEMKLPKQSQPMQQTMTMAQDFNFSALKKLTNGGCLLQLEFEDETMDMSQGKRKLISFDSTQSSTQDSNNPVALVLRKMIGARIQYVTDADGKVEKIEGFDELMNKIMANEKPQQQAMFKQMFSKDSLKQYGSFSDALPDHPVKIGDSWSVNKNIAMPGGDMKIGMNYTFKNWEQIGDRKCAHFVDTGDISSKDISFSTNMTMQIEKGKVFGDVWFDPDLGMIADVNSEQNMTMKMTMRGQAMTTQINQKIRETLVDVEDTK